MEKLTTKPGTVLEITHNPHLSGFETIKEYINKPNTSPLLFYPEDALEKIIKNDSLWKSDIRTEDGRYIRIAASRLEDLFEYDLSNISFPNHTHGLYLSHNDITSFENVEDYLATFEDMGSKCKEDWESLEHRQRAIATNEMWELQWYTSSVGSYNIMAPTFEELMELAVKWDIYKWK